MGWDEPESMDDELTQKPGSPNEATPPDETARRRVVVVVVDVIPRRLRAWSAAERERPRRIWVVAAVSTLAVVTAWVTTRWILRARRR